MWTDTRLLDLLKIEHPIIQAPMAGSTTPAMAAAAANAGCLGSLGCAFMTPDGLETAVADSRARTNRAINLNFFCHAPPEEDPEKSAVARAALQPLFDERGLGDVPAMVATNFPYGAEIHAMVMKLQPQVISFHFGLPPAEMLSDLKRIGTVILCSATTSGEARWLEDAGVDAVIAQGWEAGGHHGYFDGTDPARIGTMALVPMLVDAVDVPVIAAGGIADGRGIAAALALGAAGVQIGTAFLTATEAGVSDSHRAALLASDGTHTRPTRAFSGRPARGIVNRYMREMEEAESTLPDFPIMNTVTAPLRASSATAGDGDFSSLWAGQAVGLARAMPVSEIVMTLVEETATVLGRLPRRGERGH